MIAAATMTTTNVYLCSRYYMYTRVLYVWAYYRGSPMYQYSKSPHTVLFEYYIHTVGLLSGRKSYHYQV